MGGRQLNLWSPTMEINETELCNAAEAEESSLLVP